MENEMEILARTKKNSFVMYDDWYDYFSDLELEKAGALILALFNYRFTGEDTDLSDDPIINTYAKHMIKAMKRDAGKYMDVCEVRRQNALHKKKKMKEMMQMLANGTDKEKVIEKVFDIDTDSDL